MPEDHSNVHVNDMYIPHGQEQKGGNSGVFSLSLRSKGSLLPLLFIPADEKLRVLASED